jgi:hypothetical protein
MYSMTPPVPLVDKMAAGQQVGLEVPVQHVLNTMTPPVSLVDKMAAGQQEGQMGIEISVQHVLHDPTCSSR